MKKKEVIFSLKMQASLVICVLVTCVHMCISWKNAIFSTRFIVNSSQCIVGFVECSFQLSIISFMNKIMAGEFQVEPTCNT